MINKNYDIGKKVTWIGIGTNVFLSSFKLTLGFIGRSGALVADGFNSLSDLIVNLFVQAALHYAKKPEDEQHPFGHGKIESLVSFFIGLLIGATGLVLIYENILKLSHGVTIQPSGIALIAVIVSMSVKTSLYYYTLKAGKLTNSPLIIASAHDYKSDIYYSFGVFGGILGAILGWPFLDPVAAILPAGFILKMSYTIVTESFHDLMDGQIPMVLRRKIQTAIEQSEVKYQIKEIKGRRMGMTYLINLNLLVEPYLFSQNITFDFQKLEQYIITHVPHIQSVEITASVDSQSVQSYEKHLKERVLSILDDHSGMYMDIHEIDFHFFHGQQEIHFHMSVPPDMSVQRSHDITEHLQKEIESEISNTEVIIHVEPVK